MTDVLILGSSKGLGKELYELFKYNKYKVLGISRTKGKQTDIVCDLSNKVQVSKVVENISMNSMPRNIVVNAGQGRSSKDSLEERREELMLQNFYTSKYFVEEFKKREKWMVNLESLTFINSICALENFKCSEEYKISKSELLKYSRAIAKEFIDYRVRVNSILPGNIMHENSVWKKKFTTDQDAKNFVDKTMPFSDWIYPKDIFDTIEFFINNKNVVNTEIILDGGQNLISPN